MSDTDTPGWATDAPTKAPRAVTHLELCVAVTAWALDQPWCDVATWEVSVGRAGIADVLAITDPWSEARQKPKTRRPRVAIVEVKRTREDLRADLRARKMLGYAGVASHCYLAATLEALGRTQDDAHGIAGGWGPVLEDLAQLGLPSTWGVIALSAHAAWHPRITPWAIRGAKGEPVGADVRRTWAWALARSMAWRRLHDEQRRQRCRG